MTCFLSRFRIHTHIIGSQIRSHEAASDILLCLKISNLKPQSHPHLGTYLSKPISPNPYTKKMIQNLRYIIILPSFLIAVFLIMTQRNLTLNIKLSNTDTPLTHASTLKDQIKTHTQTEELTSLTPKHGQNPSQINIATPPRESSEVEKWTHLLLGRKFVRNQDAVDKGRMARWFTLLVEDVRMRF